MTVPTFSAELDTDVLSEKVISIVAEAADIEEDEVGFDDNFVDDLGLDSIGIVGIFVDLGYEFKISQPQRDEDWHAYNTPQLVCEFAIKQLSQKSGVSSGNG